MIAESLTWLGHAGFRLELPGATIYIDPFRCGPGPAADLMLITHDHFDHFSPGDVKALITERTEVVAPQPVTEKLRGHVTAVRAGDLVEARGIEVRVVAAYNTNKFRAPGVLYHPPEAGGVGYVIVAPGGERVYHAGDTDVIPEMDEIGDVDVALLPVSGTYVMTAGEAAEAARRLQPGLAIPMHWGEIAGDEADAEEFARLCPVPVSILARYEQPAP